MAAEAMLFAGTFALRALKGGNLLQVSGDTPFSGTRSTIRAASQPLPPSWLPSPNFFGREKTPRRKRRATRIKGHFPHGGRSDAVRRNLRASRAEGRKSPASFWRYALFGNTINDARGKPTTAALLATVAEFLRHGEGSLTEPSPPCAEGMSDSASGED